MYLYCGQSPEIGLKIFTIIFVYCFHCANSTQDCKCYEALPISHQEYNSQYAPVVAVLVYITFKNSLKIHEENTKKNHRRVVSLYVDKDFPSFT